MSTKKTITLNTIYQLLGRFGITIFTFLTSIIITRYLGKLVWGEYSEALNYISLFYLITDLGISTYLAKDFSVDAGAAMKRFSQILVFKVFIGAVLIVLAGVISWLMPYSYEVKTAIFAGLPLILSFSVFNTVSLIFQSQLMYSKQMYSYAAWAGLSFIGIYFYIMSMGEGSSLSTIVVISSLSSLIAAALSLYFVRDYLHFNDEAFDYPYIKKVMIGSLFVGLTLLMNTLMFSSDKIVLSVMSTSVSVGIYSLAYKVFEIFLIFPTLLMNSIYPFIARVKVNSEKDYKKYITSIMVFNFIAWIFLASAGIYSFRIFLPLLWGSEMAPAWNPFLILIITSLPFYLTAPLNWLAVLENRSKQMAAIYTAGFVINLILNLIYIPLFDYMAAAVVTGFTELIVLIMLGWLMRRELAYAFRSH